MRVDDVAVSVELDGLRPHRERVVVGAVPVGVVEDRLDTVHLVGHGAVSVVDAHCSVPLSYARAGATAGSILCRAARTSHRPIAMPQRISRPDGKNATPAMPPTPAIAVAARSHAGNVVPAAMLSAISARPSRKAPAPQTAAEPTSTIT